MPRRQFQRSFSRSSRPNRSWTGLVASATIVPTSTKVLLGTFVLSNPGIDETVLRSVGQISVSTDNDGASEQQVGAWGMCIVSDVALAIGITALPSPVSEISDDFWFVHQTIVQRTEFITAAGFHPNVSRNYEFDSKAKRKLEDGSVIVLVAENSGPHGFQMACGLRLLSQVSGTR